MRLPRLNPLLNVLPVRCNVSQRTPSINFNERFVELNWAVMSPFDGVNTGIEEWIGRIVFERGRYCVRHHAESIQGNIATELVPVRTKDMCDGYGHEA